MSQLNECALDGTNVSTLLVWTRSGFFFASLKCHLMKTKIGKVRLHTEKQSRIYLRIVKKCSWNFLVCCHL